MNGYLKKFAIGFAITAVSIKVIKNVEPLDDFVFGSGWF